MAGCYGNSVEDRYFEGMLYRYLEEGEDEQDSEEEYLEEEEMNDS